MGNAKNECANYDICGLYFTGNINKEQEEILQNLTSFEVNKEIVEISSLPLEKRCDNGVNFFKWLSYLNLMAPRLFEYYIEYGVEKEYEKYYCRTPASVSRPPHAWYIKDNLLIKYAFYYLNNKMGIYQDDCRPILDRLGKMIKVLDKASKYLETHSYNELKKTRFFKKNHIEAGKPIPVVTTIGELVYQETSNANYEIRPEMLEKVILSHGDKIAELNRKWFMPVLKAWKIVKSGKKSFTTSNEIFEELRIFQLEANMIIFEYGLWGGKGQPKRHWKFAKGMAQWCEALLLEKCQDFDHVKSAKRIGLNLGFCRIFETPYIGKNVNITLDDVDIKKYLT